MVKSIDLDSASRSDHTPFLKKEKGDLLYYLLTFLLILALAVAMIIGGGDLRLTLANLILIILGLNLIYWEIEGTETSEIWKSEEEFDKKVNLKLKDSSKLVERAHGGMELSQGILEKKITNLYLNKLKENRNLTQEEMRKLLKSPEEFKRVVDDDIISEFILSKKTEDTDTSEDVDEREDAEIPTEGFEGEDYEKWISKLLKRIERRE